MDISGFIERLKLEPDYRGQIIHIEDTPWLISHLSALNLVRKWGRDPLEGLYGIGNVATEVVPLYAMCHPRDVVAVVDSLNTGYSLGSYTIGTLGA